VEEYDLSGALFLVELGERGVVYKIAEIPAGVV
jgi:hypothetical protein